MHRRATYLHYSRRAGECRDGFDGRASDGIMGHAPSGQPWRDASNSGVDVNGISGGKFYSPVTAAVRALVDTGFADCSIQATLSTASNSSRLYARVGDVPPSSLGQGIHVNASLANYTLVRVMNGATTTLGTYVAVPADGDVVKLTLRGSALEVFINGTSRITATDGWGMGNTRHGLANGTTAGRWDDFTVTRI